MGRLPGGHIRGIGGVGLDPVLRKGRMGRRPLGDDSWLAVGAVLLEPRLDVGCDELARFRAAPVFDDRSELPGDAVAQQIVVRAPVGCSGGGRVVRDGRGARLEVFVAGERLGDQREPIALPAVSTIRLPSACEGNSACPHKQEQPDK